jgi:DNA-binding NarL/FixJ family response regulator/tetratricopeptide (TPR) repeat protein
VTGIARDPGGAGRPPSLPADIARQLDFLPPDVRGTLRWAALLDARFSAVELSVVTGCPAGELVVALEEAVTAGVLAADGPKLTFRHPNVRHALREATPYAMREPLHIATAHCLAEADAPPEQVAAQLVQVSDIRYGWVWDWLGRTASALARQAPQAAAELLATALEQMPLGDLPRERLQGPLLTALLLLDRHGELASCARRALAAARDPGPAADAAWHLGYALGQSGRHDEASVVLARMLSRRDLPAAMSARLHALRAAIEADGGQFDAAQAHGRDAVAEASRVSDPVALGYARYALGVVAAAGGQYEDALRLTDAAIELTTANDETAGLRLRLLGSKIGILDELGDLRAAQETTAAALSAAERLPGPGASLARTRAAAHLFRAGRWDEAVTELDLAAAAPHVAVTPLAHALRALIAGHRDRNPGAATGAPRASEAAEPGVTAEAGRERHALALAARALAAERGNRPADAVRELAAALEPERGPGLAGRYVWLPQLVRLALAAGDTQTGICAARAAEDDGRARASAAHLAAAAHCRGLLAGDPALLTAAVERYREAGSPLLLAAALEDAAEALAAGGERSGARAAYTEAARLYAGLGAEWDLRRADARMRGHGIRRGTRSAGQRSGVGWDALTRTETTVARLVSDGRSNPQIAADLFVSQATVKTHVSSILRKLKVTSRTAIAREAALH